MTCQGWVGSAWISWRALPTSGSFRAASQPIWLSLRFSIERRRTSTNNNSVRRASKEAPPGRWAPTSWSM